MMMICPLIKYGFNIITKGIKNVYYWNNKWPFRWNWIFKLNFLTR